MNETKVVTYKNNRLMQSGIKKEQVNGWSVISTGPVDGGRSALKTVGLGLIFLPLALLGKRKAAFMVTYQREAGTYPEKKSRASWKMALVYVVLTIVILMVIAGSCA